MINQKKIRTFAVADLISCVELPPEADFLSIREAFLLNMLPVCYSHNFNHTN
nr:MAG TPA: hypothetical protein [Caudoviricetes sp.]